MKMFHGGNINFNRAVNALYGEGLYVSPRREVAELHAWNGVFHEVVFKLENPYRVDNSNREEFYNLSEAGVTASQKTAMLKSMGFDGVEVMDANGEIQEVVIFDEKSLIGE